MSVKRYSVWEDEMFDEKHALNPKNSMVHLMVMHEDYAALEARCAALAAENAELRSANGIALKILNDEETMVTSLWASSIQEVEVKTPATDAFLAEVRAQGVEMLNTQFKKCTGMLYADSVVSTAEHFAAQLRQEAAQ